MPIQRTPLPIQFSGGIETKADHKSIPTTKLIDLENATFVRQTTLAKRNGYTSLGTETDAGAAVPVGVGLATRGSEILQFDGERARSYRDSSSTWTDAGEVASVVASDRPIARTGTNQTMPDHATNGGVTVAAWEDSSGGVWMSVVEEVGGRVLLAPTQLDATATRPRCVAVGGVIHVYYARGDIGRLYSVVVNPSNPSTTPAPSILTGDLSTTNQSFDAGTTTATDTPAAIAWVTALGWRVAYVAATGALGSPVTGYPSAGTYTDTVSGGIAVDYGTTTAGDKIAVLFTSSAGSTRLYQVDASDLHSSTASTVEAAGVGTRCTVAWDLEDGVWWATEHSPSTSDKNYVRSGRFEATAVTNGPSVLRGHGLVGRAFVDGGHVYAAVVHGVKFFTYVAIVRLSADTFGSSGTLVVARLLPISSAGTPFRAHLASAQLSSARQRTIALSDRIQLSSENGDQFSEVGIRIVTLDFDHVSSYQYAALGRGLYLAGACMMHYDGRRWAEADFHCAPDLSLGAASPLAAVTSGGSMADGTYNYVLSYEEVDALGETHQGAVSAPYTVVVAGGGGLASVSIACPTYRLSGKRHVRIGVYRAPAGQTGAPDLIPYYRVTSTSPSTSTGNNRYVANDATADTVTLVDGLSDANLLLREPLYIVGGILSNTPAPISGGCIAGGKARLFWTDPSDPNLVRYSQQIREETALEAPSPLTITVDPYGGSIVALAVLDDAVVVFKETAIYAFGGPGPLANPNAGQDGFSPPVLVTSDVGCKAPNSIAQSPDGIVFQSSKGIMILDRTRQVQDIGSSVYAYNDQTITRATLLPDRKQIVFLTSDEFTLLWDYERAQWSKYTNHSGWDAVVVDGVYHYLRLDGRVFRESAGLYSDAGAHIVMRIETAWIKMTGYLQGWQRVIDASILGEYKSPHTLVVRYRLDYGSDYSPPIELDVNSNFDPALYGAGPYGAGAYGGVNGYATVYQRTIPALNQRCQAISFRIEDSEATDEYGASYELSELLLVGGVLGAKFQVGELRR